MKKLLLVSLSALFLAACGAGDVAMNIPKPIEEGNDGRIQQYLEEDVMTNENAVCNFEWLHQPGGNVVEVWALCEDFALNAMGTAVKKGDMVKSFAAKITFANPSLHVLGDEGYDKFSEIAVAKINNEARDIAALEAQNLARAEKWLLGE